MLPSLMLIYYGDCKDMIQFYGNIFDNVTTQITTYSEMPFVDACGIKEENRDMVWNGSLIIYYGNNGVSFKVSDSMVTAMGGEVGYKNQAYNPLICIEHNDEEHVRALFDKLYEGAYSFEEIQKGIYSDQYGIRWIYKKNDIHSIYHCLEFNGNCSEVLDYVKNAYDIKITDLITYGDAQVDTNIIVAKDKIHSAFLVFEHDHCTYPIKYSDNLYSALHNLNGYDASAKLWYQIIIVVEDYDEEYLRKSFEKLSVGATLNRPITPNNEGYLHGSMIDQYGFVWEVMSLRND